MRYDVVALGDYLIDYTPLPDSEGGNPVLEMNVGGTSANLAAGCAGFGLSTLAVGKVGDDILGRRIRALLAGLSVDTAGLVADTAGHATTQAMVTLTGGERSFSFFRRYNADIQLALDEIDLDAVLSARAIAYTGMSFNDEPIKSTNFAILEKARAKGILNAIDVNYREPLWDSEAKFRQTMPDVVRYLDFYKSSEEEAMMIAGQGTVEEAAAALLAMGPRLVAISCGPKGAYYRCADGAGHLNTYDTRKVDTTGAGDCFFAAMLYQVLRRGGLEELDCGELQSMVDFANAAGAVSISRRGGAASMPSLEEVHLCMKNEPKLEIAW